MRSSPRSLLQGRGAAAGETSPILTKFSVVKNSAAKGKIDQERTKLTLYAQGFINQLCTCFALPVLPPTPLCHSKYAHRKLQEKLLTKLSTSGETDKPMTQDISGRIPLRKATQMVLEIKKAGISTA